MMGRFGIFKSGRSTPTSATTYSDDTKYSNVSASGNGNGNRSNHIRQSSSTTSPINGKRPPVSFRSSPVKSSPKIRPGLLSRSTSFSRSNTAIVTPTSSSTATALASSQFSVIDIGNGGAVVKVKDYALISDSSETMKPAQFPPVRPPRPKLSQELFDTICLEADRMLGKEDLPSTPNSVVGPLPTLPNLPIRSHSRSASSTPTLMNESLPPIRNTHSRSSSHPNLLFDKSRPNIADPTAIPSSVPRTFGHVTPEKNRPSALKLRTSNLSIDVAVSPLEGKMKVKGGLESEKGLNKMISSPALLQMSKPNLKDITSEMDMDMGMQKEIVSHEKPLRPQYRVDEKKTRRRSKSVNAYLNENHKNARLNLKLIDTINKEIIEGSSTIGSPSSSATTTTHDISKSFNNVPLPWDLVRVSSLSPLLTLSDVQSSLSGLERTTPSMEPMILDSGMFETCQLESERLQQELKRLKDKYEKLIIQRDILAQHLSQQILKTDSNALTLLLGNTQKVTTRADRVVRQMYVCNDQIRQIEIQLLRHHIGLLQVKDNLLEDQRKRRAVVEEEEEEDKGSEISYYLKDPSDGSRDDIDTPDLDIDDFEMINPYQHKRQSIMTITAVNGMTFPIPPSRQDIQSPSSPSSPSIKELNLNSRREDNYDAYGGLEQEDVFSASIPTSTSAIFILPPNSHRKSFSLPHLSHGLDMPYTPRMDGTERSDIKWPIPTEHSPLSHKKTPPLRLQLRKAVKGQRSQSMRCKGSSVDVIKRDRRGRDTQLETPESILLSLATAEAWTRHDD